MGIGKSGIRCWLRLKEQMGESGWNRGFMVYCALLKTNKFSQKQGQMPKK
jgi:hypothetical protein